MSGPIQAVVSVSRLPILATCMLAFGLRLTVAQILDPLRKVNLRVPALLATVMLVLRLAFPIDRAMPVYHAQRIGLVVLGTAAGAPF